MRSLRSAGIVNHKAYRRSAIRAARSFESDSATPASGTDATGMSIRPSEWASGPQELITTDLEASFSLGAGPFRKPPSRQRLPHQSIQPAFPFLPGRRRDELKTRLGLGGGHHAGKEIPIEALVKDEVLRSQPAECVDCLVGGKFAAGRDE